LSRLERLTLLSSVLIWGGAFVFGIGLLVALLNRHSQRVAYAEMALATSPTVESAAATLKTIEGAVPPLTATAIAAATPTVTETTVATPTLPVLPAGWSTATPTPAAPSSTVSTTVDTAQRAGATVTVLPTVGSVREVPEDSLQPRNTRVYDRQLPAEPPDRLVISAIKLDSPVIPIGWQTVERNGQTSRIWQVADDVVSWHKTSSYPGHTGNMVLNGHHNIKGEVFRYLIDVEVGDEVLVYAKDKVYTYAVSEKHILKELGEPLEVRRLNATWMNPTEDERLTMITCWPYTSNTHRLIVVAKPVVPLLTTEDSEGQFGP
jgi:sortase A